MKFPIDINNILLQSFISITFMEVLSPSTYENYSANIKYIWYNIKWIRGAMSIFLVDVPMLRLEYCKSEVGFGITYLSSLSLYIYIYDRRLLFCNVSP
jgi:hypothetical protein